MKTQVYGLDGTAVREIELADEVFGREVSEGSIYHAIRNELANRRVGTASTKDRGEVQSRIVAMSFCEPRSWTRVLSS